IAHDGEHHFSPRRPAHSLDRQSDVHLGCTLTVDLEDLISRLDTSARGWRVLEWSDHRHHALLFRDFDSDSTKLPRSVDLHLAERFRWHEDGVGIQGVQHSLDGAVDQLAILDRLNVVVLNVRKHAGEQLELAVSLVAADRGTRPSVRGNEENNEEADGPEAVAEIQRREPTHVRAVSTSRQ